MVSIQVASLRKIILSYRLLQKILAVFLVKREFNNVPIFFTARQFFFLR